MLITGKLTQRQFEVYILNQKGMTQDQISKKLHVSQPSVSQSLIQANKNINESFETVNFLNALRKIDYDNMELDNILKVMYERHDEFDRRKKSLQGTIIPYSVSSKKSVFTVGYEKRKIDDFVKILKGHKIDIIIDIRANGHSRKPGFSYLTLKKRLENEGIDYLQMKELGAPKKLRDGLKEKGYGWFFKEYEKYIETEPLELDKLEKITKYSKSCLMCFELEPRECHRSIVAKKLSDRGFEIAHL